MSWTTMAVCLVLLTLYLYGLVYEFRYQCGAHEAIRKRQKEFDKEYYVSCCGPVQDCISHWQCTVCKREVEPTKRNINDVKKSELMEKVGSGYGL